MEKRPIAASAGLRDDQACQAAGQRFLFTLVRGGSRGRRRCVTVAGAGDGNTGPIVWIVVSSLHVRSLEEVSTRGFGEEPSGSLLRAVAVSDLSDLARVDHVLGLERYPRGHVTVAVMISGHGPTPPGSSLHAQNIDLVLGSGHPDDESMDNQPLVLVPDVTEELERLDTALRQRPRVAEILARLLRATAGLPLETALEMESLAYGALLGGSDFRDWLTRRKAPSPAVRERVDPVLLDRLDDRLIITLNDPDRHNAYSARMRDALIEALAVPLADDSLSNVEIKGIGRSFCSGADLGEFGLADDLAKAHLVRTRQHVGRALATLGDRVQVRAHGACIGAGIEISAFAARITAARGTFFRLPELQMGLIPGAGGCVSIPRRIGRWRTLYMVLSGVDVHTDRALRWGLVDEIED